MTALAIDGLKNFEFAWNSIEWDAMRNNVNRLQARIVKAVQVLMIRIGKVTLPDVPDPNCRVLKRTLSMLEPCAGKLACTVLRELGAGNSPWLPDTPEAGAFFAFAISV